MRKHVLAAFVAACVLTPATAARYENDTMIARRGSEYIRLWEAPCNHAGTLAQIKPEYRELFKKARAMVAGQDLYACWISENGQVFIIFEDGDQTVVPVDEFKPDQGA